MTTPPNSVYSVPRKLDLASLLVFTAVYACIFALMNQLHFKPSSVAMVAVFLASVGISQAVLFGGKSPRLASALTGAAYSCLLLFFPMQFRNPRVRIAADFSNFIPIFIIGLVVGYFSGTFIGGVFLVIDQLRSRIRSLKKTDDET